MCSDFNKNEYLSFKSRIIKMYSKNKLIGGILMNKNKMFSMLLVIAMVMSLFVVPANASAENKETESHRYGFDLAAIPEAQWNQQKCEIHVTLEEEDGTKTTTIIKEESNYGSPVFLNAKVYDKITGEELKGQTLSTYWVPARLFVEKLGLGPIEWDNERGVAVLETYRGTVDLKPDSTYVTLPDGTQIAEETYKIGPNQQNIEVVKNRGGRLYVPARFWLTLCFESAEFDWHRPGVLYVTAKRPKAQSGEKDWVGVRDMMEAIGSYTTTTGAKDLPHIATAIKETNSKVGDYNGYLSLRPADFATTGSIYLETHNIDDRSEIWITNLDLGFYEAHENHSDYLKLANAILEDLISDNEDIESVMTMLRKLDEIYRAANDFSVDITTREAEAAKTKEIFSKTYEFNTIIVKWGTPEGRYVKGTLRIYSK